MMTTIMMMTKTMKMMMMITKMMMTIGLKLDEQVGWSGVAGY